MAIPQKLVTSGWFFGLGLFAFTIAATLWKQSAAARRTARHDEEALLRLDSDLG
jgi:hypothetical protein